MTTSAVVELDERSKAIRKRHESVRNLREGRQLIANFFDSGTYAIIGCVVLVLLLVFPVYLPITIIPLMVTMYLGYRRQVKASLKYPLYIPAHSKAKKDPLDIDPATRRPRKPRAQVYMGIEPTTGRQVWGTFDVAKQHHFMQATTGGGKTESLCGLFAANPLIYGSGFIFADGKADQSLPAKIAAMCHRTMRLNDFFIVNYITGNQTPWGKTESEMSSTVNPFLTGSVGSLSELVKSLLQDDGDIWSKRSQSFIDALTRVLVYLRDKGELEFNISHYSQFLQLEELGRLAGRKDIPQKVKRELYNFVKTLPGLDADGFAKLLNGEPLDPRKSQQPLDQLGYITMQIIPVVNMLSGDYGYIFDVIHGSINVRDIVLKRRVMLVLLPALEKSAPALKSLGQIVIALIRDLLASGIGNQTEGNIDRALKRRFTNDIAPYNATFDEAGYYFSENAFAPIWAQARSIGLGCCLAGQDNYAMEKSGDAAAKELKTVISNSNTKIIGKIEDHGDSMEQVLERLTEVTVYEAKRMQRNEGAISTNSYYSAEVEAEKKKALEPDDFYRLREGEVFILHLDMHVRVDCFAVFPKILKNQKANAFVPRASLPEKRRDTLINNFKSMRRKFILQSRETNDERSGEQASTVRNETFEKLDGLMGKKPSMAGAFAAIKSYEKERKESFTSKLSQLVDGLKGAGSDTEKEPAPAVNSVSEKEASESNERIAKQAESIAVSFDEGEQSNNVNVDGELSESEGVSNAFKNLFGESNDLLVDLTVLNATEAHRSGNKPREDNAASHAQLTVNKIDEALTSHPTPPVPNVNNQEFVATLEKIREMLE